MSAPALFANPIYKGYQIEVFKFEQQAKTYIMNRLDRIDAAFDFDGFNSLENRVQALSNDVKTALMSQLDSVKQSLIKVNKDLANKFLQPEQVQQQFISQ